MFIIISERLQCTDKVIFQEKQMSGFRTTNTMVLRMRELPIRFPFLLVFNPSNPEFLKRTLSNMNLGTFIVANLDFSHKSITGLETV